VPPLLPEALKAIEDRKFETHHGVNPLAILRAAFVNVRAGQVEQGGSTLTQQLVKSYFLDSRRTLGRKAEEAVMAVILESRFEKADIMNAYINEIYLGQDGQRAIHGFGLASQFYFGKPLAELDLPEIALMVAIVRGPSYYDPRRHPDRALTRRNLVLRVLGERGVVSVADAERAAAKPLGVARAGQKSAVFFPAFLDLVRRQLRADYKEEDLTESGLVVFSTLDPLLQEKAEYALESELDRQDASARKVSHGLEGVVVVTAPQTGEVVAMVGGRRFQPRARREAADRLAREAAGLPIGAGDRPLHARHHRSRPAGHDQAAERPDLEARELRPPDPRRHARGARAHAVAQPADGEPRSRGRAAARGTHLRAARARRGTGGVSLDAARRDQPEPV
jgi:membrane peptidoglycan carboxypeptidase